MGPIAKLLHDGARLHLQHGPIDLIIGAEGERNDAFEAAQARFATVLDELVRELPALREPLTQNTVPPEGRIAQRMHAACAALCKDDLTRMAAVAGAVADEVLRAMTNGADLRRAYVNNGGDIAMHLSHGAQFTTAMQTQSGRSLGKITVTSRDPIRGIATSGRHGRSLSLGIADSVTVLADTAASADVAATVIGNAVDLPGHRAITRKSACDIVDDSDLGMRPVVVDCAPLSFADSAQALGAGRVCAQRLQDRNLIIGAGLFLQGHATTTTTQFLNTHTSERLYA